MKKLKKTMAFLIALLVMFGTVLGNSGMTALAAEETETTTWTQVTDESEITSGEYLLVAESDGAYYALGTTIGSKIDPVSVSVSNGSVSADSLPVWTLTDTEDGITLSNGSAYLAYSSSTNFKSSDTADYWTAAAETGNTFSFTNAATTGRGIAYGVSQGKFGAYAVSNSTSDSYVFNFMLFRQSSGSGSEATTVDTPSATYSEADMTVTFSCKTSDVTYYYSTSEEGEFTALEGTTLDVSGYLGQTLYYYAAKDAVKSTVCSVELTTTSLTGLTDGTYVVWAPAYYKALSTTMTGSFYAGVDLNDTSEGSLTGYGSTEIWTVTVTMEDDGTQSVTLEQDGKYMGVSSSNRLSFGETDNIDWVLEETDEDGIYYLKNSGTERYLEWYDDYSDWSVYYSVISGSEEMFEIKFAAVDAEDSGDDKDDGSVTGTLVSSISQGDQVVLYYPNGGLAMTGTASSSKLTGVSGTVETTDGESILTTTSDALVLTVRETSDGYYTFENNGLYLTSGSSGSSLTLSAKSDYSLWIPESTDEEGSFYLKNVNAKYGSNSQYLEYYSGFTTYSFSSGNPSIYTYQFYKTGTTEIGKDYETDASVVEDIAQWGGGGPYTDGTTSVPGDKYEVNDMKDSAAAFTAVVSGSAVQAFTTGTSSGSTDISNWYMGGTGLGSGTDDYLQFALSTAGWGDMSLSFRMRASASGSGEWQLQHSTDGDNFTDFTTGSYSCSYTSYSSDGSSSAVSLSGEITDGVAKTSIKSATYITFEFDVPAGAENAENLYIRLVPSTTVRASGSSSAPSSQGTVRVDSVVLSGSPIVDESITGYVQVSPDNSEDQAVGTELTLTSSTEGATIYYRFVDTDGDGSESWNTYSETDKPVLSSLPATLETRAVSDGLQDSVTRILTYAAGTVATVKMTPNGGGVYIDENGSQEVVLTCATEGATIWYNTGETDSDGNDIYNEYTCSEENGSAIILEKGFGSLTVKAYATLDGYSDSALVTRNFTERSQETYNIYFGQLHSHTNYSDGAGSITDAYEHALEVHETTDTLDFLAVTDHSNSFDNASSDSVTITDGSSSEEWTEGNAYAESYSEDNEFIALFGFEMTWSNGLGHLNTFNTDGFQSRTQSAYTTYSTALQNYYETLKTVPESLSQFNHPGTTFGDFSDFSYYDEDIDDLITMIEVGNGEGTIGSSSYYPSYEYYTRCLDKGWHIAPTNNQDNHKGLWGDANTARSVILADELTEDSIYDALRNYRAYATEDNDLSVYYQLDGNVMGSILTEDDVDDTVTLTVNLSDPTDDSLGKVEVIVNGGYSLASQTVSGNEDLVTFEVGSDYSYYYIKVTEADGDIAVTAPVWVGDVEAVGITGFDTDAVVAVQDESLTLNLELYNNENDDFQVESVVFSYLDEDEDGNSTYVTIHEADITEFDSVVKSMSTASYSFDYTYTGLGSVNYYATVTGTLNGVTKVYTEVLQLNYVASSMVTNVIVDGSHYNDYVTGYYGGNISDLTTIAGNLSIDLEVVEDVEDYYGEDSVLSDCALLIISAPAKYSGTANAGDYTASLFEDEFIEAVKEYVEAGGSVIVCGLADYSDKNAASADYHTAAQMNKLLAAIGSSMSLNDDEAYDAENNGGQFYRLYLENFNMDSEWLSGVVSVDDVEDGEDYQTYSQYSGCTVNAGDGTWLVKGFDTTYSVDSDKDGVGASDEKETDDSYGYNIVTEKGEAVFLACEDSGYGGTIFASGGVFCSDFEVDADIDDYDLGYANTNIITNILKAVQVQLDVTPIAEVRAVANTGATGDVFKVRGYVTAGTANSDTAFFDCIYIQDETGGIDIFPYAESGLEIGSYVEVTGYLASYQGDLELKVISSTVLDSENLQIQDPVLLSCDEAMNYETNGGRLIRVEGTVKEGSICYNSDGTLAQFVVVDENGKEAKVFIDGYILSGTNGKNILSSYVKAGETVSAVGVLYMHPEVLVDESDETYGEEVPVLRVRDCDEIITISDGSFASGSDTEVTVVSGGQLSQLTAVTVDGVSVLGNGAAVLTADDEGGVLVTLTADYLNTLSVGCHGMEMTFVVNGSSCTVSNTLTVTEEEIADGKDLLCVRRGNTFCFQDSIRSTAGTQTVSFGKNGDEVLVGDWDGDGVDTLCVRRGNTFYFQKNLTDKTAYLVVSYGKADDEILVGDWDGDGVDTLCARRGNRYYFMNSLTSGIADEQVCYGKASDEVLTGDWDGDGADTLCARRGNRYYFMNSLTSGSTDEQVRYGKASDEVLAGDWDGDGADTLCVRRGNTCYIQNTLSAADVAFTVNYGKSADELLAGCWR